MILELTEQLQKKRREIIVILADINDIEQNLSRIRNEILELDKAIADKLNN